MKAYEEIMNALKLYYAEDGDVLTDESVYEIIGQAHEPLGTVAKALDEYRAANSPELPDGWIKCSDELPPEGYEEDGGSVSVLVWYKDKPDCGHPYGISNVFFVRKHWEKWYTHWQPLPAPPTTEK